MVLYNCIGPGYIVY